MTHPVSEKSVVDLLKEEYATLATEKIVFIPIKGWERTGLSIKYRHPNSGKELDAVARKVMQEVDRSDNYRRGFLIALDTIIKLAEGLYVKPPGVEDYVELDPQETGRALDLGDGEELASIFGWNDVNSSRQVVRKLFGDNDLAIINHSEKLQRWLVDTKADLNTELWQMGELS